MNTRIRIIAGLLIASLCSCNFTEVGCIYTGRVISEVKGENNVTVHYYHKGNNNKYSYDPIDQIVDVEIEEGSYSVVASSLAIDLRDKDIIVKGSADSADVLYLGHTAVINVVADQVMMHSLELKKLSKKIKLKIISDMKFENATISGIIEEQSIIDQRVYKEKSVFFPIQDYKTVESIAEVEVLGRGSNTILTLDVSGFDQKCQVDLNKQLANLNLATTKEIMIDISIKVKENLGYQVSITNWIVVSGADEDIVIKPI